MGSCFVLLNQGPQPTDSHPKSLQYEMQDTNLCET
jgi:hypothetical protein